MIRPQSIVKALLIAVATAFVCLVVFGDFAFIYQHVANSILAASLALGWIVFWILIILFSFKELQ